MNDMLQGQLQDQMQDLNQALNIVSAIDDTQPSFGVYEELFKLINEMHTRQEQILDGSK